MKLQKIFNIDTVLIFKLIQISFFNWSEAEGSVSHI